MSATSMQAMSIETVSVAVPHFKTRGFSGEHRLERCEDSGCSVGADGHADCGRLACPACGFSGSNLSEPDALEGLIGCSCGHVFETH